MLDYCRDVALKAARSGNGIGESGRIWVELAFRPALPPPKKPRALARACTRSLYGR
jgi:hypothetical protein